jgi:hypothetical protein
MKVILASGLVVAASTAHAAAIPDPNKTICKNENKKGSRVANKICHTAAEWDAISEQAKRDAADSFNKSNRPTDDRDVLPSGTLNVPH